MEDCFNSCSTSRHGSLLFHSSSFHCDIIIIALVSAFFYLTFLSMQYILLHVIPTALFVLIKATAFGPTPKSVICSVARQTLLLFPPPILPSGVNSHTTRQHKDAQTKFSVCNYLQKFCFFYLSRHSDFHTCPSLSMWGSRKKEQRHKVEEKHHRLANNWLAHGLLLITTLLLDSSLSSNFHLDRVAVTYVTYDMNEVELGYSTVMAFNKNYYNQSTLWLLQHKLLIACNNLSKKDDK